MFEVDLWKNGEFVAEIRANSLALLADVVCNVVGLNPDDLIEPGRSGVTWGLSICRNFRDPGAGDEIDLGRGWSVGPAA